jgi:hypothetical protein
MLRQILIAPVMLAFHWDSAYLGNMPGHRNFSSAGYDQAPVQPPTRRWQRSLRFRLLLLWLMIAAACGVAAFLMIEMFRISVAAQIDRADAVLARGCASIADRYRFYAAGSNGPQDLQNEMLRRDLQAAVSLALRDDLGLVESIGRAPQNHRGDTWPLPTCAALLADRPDEGETDSACRSDSNYRHRRDSNFSVSRLSFGRRGQ